MPEAAFLLMQFPYSHFNEKARWVFDLKRVPHRRRSLLPGPHIPYIKRLTGQTAVPVLREGDRLVVGSAAIIDMLEERYPDPPLYPADPGTRERALGIQRWFDEEVGPCVRRALFSVLLDEPDYVCGMFTEERGALTRTFYRGTFPLARGMMKKSMGITGAGAVAEAYKKTAEALEFVAARSADTGYLAGGAFSVADLAAASLLAPAVAPAGTSMELPKPRPAALLRWFDRWAGHPGAAWVNSVYRRHRPESAELRG